MYLIPNKDQWKKWSLPSKLTVISAYLAIIPIVISIISISGNAVYGYLSHQYSIHEELLSNEMFSKNTGKNITDPGLSIKVVYPHIKSLMSKSIFQQANKEIIDSIVSNLKPDVIDLLRKYSITMKNDRVLSIMFESYSYYQGALNGDGSFGSINIDLKNDQFIEFFDVFDVRKNPVIEIKRILRKKLDERCILDDHLNSERYIPRFSLSENEVIFLFSEYEATAGFCGHFTIGIPYDDVSSYIRKDGTVGSKFKASANWDGREHKKNGVGIYY
jgi:hypothetical protein